MKVELATILAPRNINRYIGFYETGEGRQSLNYLGTNATLQPHVSAVRRPYPVEGPTHCALPGARKPSAFPGRPLTRPLSQPTVGHCPRRRLRGRGPPPQRHREGHPRPYERPRRRADYPAPFAG